MIGLVTFGRKQLGVYQCTVPEINLFSGCRHKIARTHTLQYSIAQFLEVMEGRTCLKLLEELVAKPFVEVIQGTAGL